MSRLPILLVLVLSFTAGLSTCLAYAQYRHGSWPDYTAANRRADPAWLFLRGTLGPGLENQTAGRRGSALASSLLGSATRKGLVADAGI